MPIRINNPEDIAKRALLLEGDNIVIRIVDDAMSVEAQGDSTALSLALAVALKVDPLIKGIVKDAVRLANKHDAETIQQTLMYHLDTRDEDAGDIPDEIKN